MKRILRCALLCLMLCLPLPVWAQAAFDDAMAELDAVMSSGAEDARILQTLTGILRKSRALGRNEPDFAIFYAMLADQLRNVEKNPVYALQIVEEGLALIAGDPTQQDFAAILQVTRSYALADLGRLEEAYAQAQLALPAYRQVYDADFVEDYVRDAASWGQGQMSDFNTPATELARVPLEQANAALEQAEYGRVIALASMALLPLGTGLAEADVRGVNVQAEMMIAEALARLGRDRQAANAWLRALGYMTQTPWQLHGEPDWWGAGPANADLQGKAFEIFQGLADAAVPLGRPDVEQAALEQAAQLAHTPVARYEVLIRRARIAFAGDDAPQAAALIAAARDTATQAGYEVGARMAAFYLSILEALQTLHAGGSVDPAPILTATEAALDSYRAFGVPGEDFLFTEAAKALVRSGHVSEGLRYARRGLEALRARLTTRKDTGAALAQARRDARTEVEFFLRTAHLAASNTLDDRLVPMACDADKAAYNGCIIVGP